MEWESIGTLCGNECLICGDKAEVWTTNNFDFKFIECESCGRVYYNTAFCEIDKTILASYLFYNGVINKPSEDKRFYYFIGPKEKFFEVQKENPWTKYLSKEECEAWYPKTFSEKVDMVLLGLAKLSKYDGDSVVISEYNMYSLLFVDVDCDKPREQCSFLREYLTSQKYIEKSEFYFCVLPDGLMRIDELQKNQINNKNVFIAMSFSEDMKPIKEKIKEAITSSGYIPRIMDEIEHNNQIVPEMLFEIRNSKFLIAELTEHNNGAYFEEGYALGLEKEIIQLCRKDRFGKDGHFDVKQINTVLWESEDDLFEKLIKRIEATII